MVTIDVTIFFVEDDTNEPVIILFGEKNQYSMSFAGLSATNKTEILSVSVGVVNRK